MKKDKKEFFALRFPVLQDDVHRQGRRAIKYGRCHFEVTPPNIFYLSTNKSNFCLQKNHCCFITGVVLIL